MLIKQENQVFTSSIPILLQWLFIGYKEYWLLSSCDTVRSLGNLLLLLLSLISRGDFSLVEFRVSYIILHPDFYKIFVINMPQLPFEGKIWGTCLKDQCFKCFLSIWNYLLPFVHPSVFLFIHPWWHHEMETFSALLAICAGNSLVPGEFPPQRPVTWSCDVFFDLCLNKQLSKQWWGWWFETLSYPFWRHRNVVCPSQMP